MYASLSRFFFDTRIQINVSWSGSGSETLLKIMVFSSNWIHTKTTSLTWRMRGMSSTWRRHSARAPSASPASTHHTHSHLQQYRGNTHFYSIFLIPVFDYREIFGSMTVKFTPLMTAIMIYDEDIFSLTFLHGCKIFQLFRVIF